MKLFSLRRIVCATAALTLAAATASAQTLTLTDGNATTLRAGSYASTNYGSADTLETRASSTPDYVRRTLLKFDTSTTIPAGTPITSATLTMTVAPGSNSQTRQLSAYQERSSYDESVASWTRRNGSTSWSEAGGDLGARYAVGTVTGTAGSKVTFDVTALVSAIVRGDFGSSRYTRIVLIDEGASSRDSYKQFYSDEVSDATLRPTLTIVTGSSGSLPPPPSTDGGSGSTGTTLRVLQWNTHHGGYGTDGKYDTDRLASWIVKMQPDIISLNEIEYYTGWGNQDQPAIYASLLKQKTGHTWYYTFATASGATKGDGNLILSRFPLEASARLQLVDTRVVVQVTVMVNGRTINFFSTHLDDQSSTARLNEIAQLKPWASGMAEQRIVAGDFNTQTGHTEITNMTADYVDSWAQAVKNGSALAFSGDEAGNTRNSRIDYIFYSKNASALVLKSVQVYDTRDANGVMPSDHRPLVSTFTVK